MATKSAVWVGETIADGRYKVLSQLGEGSMGTVFRAFDHRLETEVVIKAPRPEMLADEFKERFQRETRSLVRLSHPHVVRILDVGDHADCPFVVMQSLAGGSLKSRISPAGEGRPMTLASLREWLPHVADALDFTHAQNYVHRDVKPANILFDGHNNAFLSDFGLTKVLSEEEDRLDSRTLTAAGFLVGTADYVSPEVVMGKQADGRSDQYSLAVTVHEALSGRVPFNGRTSSAVLVMQTTSRPPILHELVPDVPPELSQAVLRALAKDPRQRFPTCGEFAEAVLARVPVSRSSRVALPATPIPAEPASSRGPPGRVPCPRCQRVLNLKPEFGGKRGKCQYCQSNVLISKDIRQLTLVPLAQKTAQASRQMSLPAQGRLAQTDDTEVLLEERVFGFRISRRKAQILGGGLVFLLLVGAAFGTYLLTRPAPQSSSLRSAEDG